MPLIILLAWIFLPDYISAGSPTMFICGVDPCTVGVHFCHRRLRMCQLCSDPEYVKDCFTDSHQPNCTSVCYDAVRETLLKDLRDQDCPPPPGVFNAIHNGTSGNSSIGQTVGYSCNSGYALHGEGTLTCGDFGQWSGSLPYCSQIDLMKEALLKDLREQDCPPPPGVLNAVHNGTSGNSSIGQTVGYSCNSGYALHGEGTLTCGDFGQWSGSLPYCGQIGNQSTYGQFWCIASICTFILLILAMVAISILWCKVKRLKKKLPKKGNIKDVESEGSSRTETPASVRRGPASKNDQAQQALLASGVAEGVGEPSQPGDSDETERKCSLDEDIEHGEHVTIDTSRESALFRGVQEERKGATGEHHASARPVEPRPPDDEQSEEERGDENLFCAQASSYHQQERPNEGTSNKIAMQRGGEVAPEDLGYTLSD